MRLLRNNTVTISNVTRQLHKEEVWILIIRKYMKNNPLLRDVRKKNEKKGGSFFLIILILAVAGGTGFYFMQRQKPISATEDFLENMRAMNFDGMKNLLQSNDMSALDNADITSDAYSSFFKKINE